MIHYIRMKNFSVVTNAYRDDGCVCDYDAFYHENILNSKCMAILTSIYRQIYSPLTNKNKNKSELQHLILCCQAIKGG